MIGFPAESLIAPPGVVRTGAGKSDQLMSHISRVGETMIIEMFALGMNPHFATWRAKISPKVYAATRIFDSTGTLRLLQN